MANYPRRNYRKRPVVRKAVKPKRKYAKRTSIVKTVKSVLAKQVETKVLQYSGSLVPRTINAATTQVQADASTMFLTPQGATIAGITQGYPILGNGIGQDQRIGDAVKIKGQYLNFLIQANPYDITYNPTPKPQLVTVWIIKPKVRAISGLDISKIQSGTGSCFYENQANADSGMGGTLLDLLRKPDRDNYQIISSRQYKVGFQGNLSTTNVVNSYQNNDFKYFYKGVIKLKGSSWKVSRQDEPQTQPTFCFITCIPADGSTQSTTIIPVAFNFNLTTYYTDM